MLHISFQLLVLASDVLSCLALQRCTVADGFLDAVVNFSFHYRCQLQTGSCCSEAMVAAQLEQSMFILIHPADDVVAETGGPSDTVVSQRVQSFGATGPEHCFVQRPVEMILKF
ncbi:hypothetical protein ElyMa_005659400 [Elysia marginata]|uniref:Secreted protein n=1 Tax=Elysia marginata TaxID=1093978 RepID=A0AAV4FD21_9GAST|nr:hypothetical protein ElyMa_005659400 [Elysia marginata]